MEQSVLGQRNINPSLHHHIHAPPPGFQHSPPPVRDLWTRLTNNVLRRQGLCNDPRATADRLAEAVRVQPGRISQQQDGAEHDDAGLDEGAGARWCKGVWD